MDILATTPIYVDSAAAQDRGYQIDSFITGTGTIEWRQFGTTLAGVDLNITCTSNTFSGPWHIFQGCLLASGTNSLGTGPITVENGGALEIGYNLRNGGDLVLRGQMFLHQNVTNRSAVIGTTGLFPGTYTFAQLNAMFPANFPGGWALQAGSAVTTASGSLTVQTAPAGVLLSSFSGGNFQLIWSTGVLEEATDVFGPWTTNNNSSPYTFVPVGPQKFYRVQLQ
jgi:hypothetical protein